MASPNFITYIAYSPNTVVTAAWLNDVAIMTYVALGGASQVAPTSAAQVLANLGITGAGGYAPLASPAFTGTPTAPTAANGTNNNQLATTQFVVNDIASGDLAASFTTLATTGTVEANGGYVTYGSCQLQYTSGTTITLVPKNGNLLTIGGVNYKIPSAGVTLVSPTMTTNTLYYIYATQSGGTISLVASTVGHAPDSTTGVECWTTDNTHTLVGMVYCVTANTFTSSATQRLVRSWFNDPGIGLTNAFSTNRTTTSTTFTELNSEIRINFCSWANEVVNVYANALVTASATAQYIATAVGLNSTTSQTQISAEAQAFASSAAMNESCSGALIGLTEGFNFLTLLGFVTSGTGTWVGGNVLTNGAACALSAFIHR